MKPNTYASSVHKSIKDTISLFAWRYHLRQWFSTFFDPWYAFLEIGQFGCTPWYNLLFNRLKVYKLASPKGTVAPRLRTTDLGNIVPKFEESLDMIPTPWTLFLPRTPTLGIGNVWYFQLKEFEIKILFEKQIKEVNLQRAL